MLGLFMKGLFGRLGHLPGDAFDRFNDHRFARGGLARGGRLGVAGAFYDRWPQPRRARSLCPTRTGRHKAGRGNWRHLGGGIRIQRALRENVRRGQRRRGRNGASQSRGIGFADASISPCRRPRRRRHYCRATSRGGRGSRSLIGGRLLCRSCRWAGRRLRHHGLAGSRGGRSRRLGRRRRRLGWTNERGTAHLRLNRSCRRPGSGGGNRCCGGRRH